MGVEKTYSNTLVLFIVNQLSTHFLYTINSLEFISNPNTDSINLKVDLVGLKLYFLNIKSIPRFDIFKSF